MSTNIKNKHGAPGRDDGLHAPALQKQHTQQNADHESIHHRATLAGNRTYPQTTAQSPLPLPAKLQGAQHRTSSSDVIFSRLQGIQGTFNDDNTNTVNGPTPGSQNRAQGFYNYADHQTFNFNWTNSSGPSLPRINNVLADPGKVVVPPPHHPSNSYNKPYSGIQSYIHGSGGTQQDHSQGTGTLLTSSVPIATPPNEQHGLGIHPMYALDQGYLMTALQFDSHSFVDSSSSDGYDFGLGFEIGSYDPSFHERALSLSTVAVQASETTHRILDFQGLGLEEVVDFVAPDHTKIELAYTTHDTAIQGVNDDFRNDKMYWESPKPDVSIPQTQAHRQEIVRILLAAMKDPSKAVDHQMRSFKKRWAADAPNGYSDSIMEATCWKIAELSERLHVEGPTVLCVATENAIATNKDSASLTLEERIRYLVVILTQFKARCENLIKGTFLHTVVGNPKQALKDSHLNARVNPRRQECLAFAHEHMAEDKANKRKRHNHLKVTITTEGDFGNITTDELADSDERESTLSSLNNGSCKRLRSSSDKAP